MQTLSSFAVSASPHLATMVDADASHRRDVESVLIFSRSIEYFPIGCISTQNAVHDSRLQLVEAYAAQAELLRKLKPSMPIVVASSPAADGSFPILRAVVPRSSVVEVVRGKPTRSVKVPTDSALRTWKSDIDSILGKIGVEFEVTLDEGVEAFIVHRESKLELRRLNTQLGSPSSRKRMRKSRAELESRREIVRVLNDMAYEQRLAIVRSRINRIAIEAFYEEGCKKGREYIFRERRQ